MGGEEGARFLSRIQRVRCLSCGDTYVKPTNGGTVSANPGCPVCGYVGWVVDSSPVRRRGLQLRSAAGRPQRRTG